MENTETIARELAIAYHRGRKATSSQSQTPQQYSFDHWKEYKRQAESLLKSLKLGGLQIACDATNRIEVEETARNVVTIREVTI